MSARAILAAAAGLLLGAAAAARAADTPAPTVHQGGVAHGSICEQIIAAAALRSVQDGGDVLEDNTVDGAAARDSWKNFVERLTQILGPEPPTERLALPDYITAKGPVLVSERWRLASGKNIYIGCVAVITKGNRAGVAYYVHPDSRRVMDSLRAALEN